MRLVRFGPDGSEDIDDRPRPWRQWHLFLAMGLLAPSIPFALPAQTVRADSAPLQYFAEGTTQAGFQEYLTFLNTGEATSASITYIIIGGPPQTQQVQLPAHARSTVDVNKVIGPGHDVSIGVDLGGNNRVKVERPLYFNACVPICMDGNNVASASTPALEWFFADGFTGAGFQEYLMLLNPGTGPAHAIIAYDLSPGRSGTIAATIPPLSRLSIDVNKLVGEDQQVSVHVSADISIVAERSMYFQACPGGVCMSGGSVTRGIQPQSSWYFPEGYTGPGFQEYLLLYNPSDVPTNAITTYMYTRGATATRPVSVPAHTRVTVDVNRTAEAAKEVSALVASDTPIVVERALYYELSNPAHPTYANGGTGVTGQQPGTSWDFSEGFTGPGFQEYVILLNSNQVAATAYVTYLDESGGSNVWGHSLAPNSRLTVDINQLVHGAKQIGVDVTANLPLVAERVIYAHGCLGKPQLCFNVPPPPSAPPRPRDERPFRLTVDDCGSEAQLRGVIDTAAARNMQNIWFFPTGQCRDQFPWLVPTILAHGWVVCNHSYSHPVMTHLSDAGIADQISRGVSWQSSGCHQFRPPYGAWDGANGRVARVASSLGYGIFLWDIDTRDWAGTSASAMVAMIRGRRGTVLIHFHGAHTIEALQQL